MKFNWAKARALVDASPIKEEVIADRCTIEKKTLQQYLRGNGKPSFPVLRLLAQTLNVPEAELQIPDREAKRSA